MDRRLNRGRLGDLADQIVQGRMGRLGELKLQAHLSITNEFTNDGGDNAGQDVSQEEVSHVRRQDFR